MSCLLQLWLAEAKISALPFNHQAEAKD